MKYYTHYLVSALLGLTMTSILAADPCAQLAGTYSGHYNDKTGIYPKNLPIRITIRQEENHFYAQLMPVQGMTLLDGSMKMSGICDNGELKFYTYAQFPDLCSCGQSVGTLKKNKLNLNLCWQTAMSGGYGIAKLTKESDAYQGSKQSFKRLWQYPEEVYACH